MSSKIAFENFESDWIIGDAVLRNLEIIGEAVKALPADFKAVHGSIDWRKISGLRDILIHHYFGIDKKIIWDIIQNKIPELKSFVEEIIKSKQ